MTKREVIDDLLKYRTDLKCELVYKKDVNTVREILNLDEFKDSRFSHLLTPSVWQMNS